MAYSKTLAKAYAANRNNYTSSDKLVTPFLKKAGVKGKVILDFGCGDGPETERFIKMKAKKVVGVDPSAEMIKLAKTRNLPNATFIQTDGKVLPLKNKKFDVVYSRFVLHYIKDLNSQFSEISRVLKPNGYFIALFQCLTDNIKYINKRVPINLGKGKNITKIQILSKSTDEVRNALMGTDLKIITFPEVKNTDAHIDAKYLSKYNFKNTTFILFAQRKP